MFVNPQAFFAGMVRRNNSILGRGEGPCQANFGASHHKRRVALQRILKK